MPYKKITGIYKILNNFNNKFYIGSAISIYNRFTQHKRLLRNNSHFNLHLQSSWNKYKEDSFSFIILEECLEGLLCQREEFWINHLKANNTKFGYNKRIDCTTNLGIKASKETKEKLRISHLGYKRSQEVIEKIKQSRYKKICQFDQDGNYVKTYNSILEASKETGIGKTLISACCRKILPWTNNTFWSFETEKDNFILPIIKKRTGGWINGKREKRN